MRIYTGEPSIPNLKKFNSYLNIAVKNKWLSNEGDLLKLFKRKIQKRLGIKNFVFVTSGTSGLELALKVLNVKRNVYVPPFTFVATANAAKWVNLNVKFSDIDNESLNLDPKLFKISQLNMSDAIIPVHSFGIPADINSFEKYRKKTKIIYDASHCFDVKFNNKSILSFGDASVVSLHATKVFNTCEGGIVVFKKKKHFLLAKKYLSIGAQKNTYQRTYGVNMKMNELQAAWGLSLLDIFDNLKKKRSHVHKFYIQNLSPEIKIPIKNSISNFCYFPIIIKNEKKLKMIINKLKSKNIFLKRYFYPSLNLLNHLKAKRYRKSEEVSKKIVCLPIHENLNKNVLNKIINTINSNI